MDRSQTVGIVGVGLIGASIGLAMRHHALAARVVGVDVDPAAIDAARGAGAIDAGGSEVGALRDADVVFVAVPPDAVIPEALRAAAAMKSGSILTDVASIKATIVRALDERVPSRVRYIGGHPMAGSENRGARHAGAGLLAGRPYLLTPTRQTDPAAVSVMTGLVEQLGMQPVLLAPDDHDELVAQISHVPYLLAVAAVRVASERAIGVGGPAFGGLARLAASPVDLWTQICKGNRAAIKRALAQFRLELERLERALDGEEALDVLLQHSRQHLGVN